MINKAIFWDLEGTLIYPNESFFNSLKDTINKYGYQIDSGLIKEFLNEHCSWHNPHKDYIDSTGENWWKELLDNTKIFCKDNNIDKKDLEVICKDFRYNVVNYKYKLYDDSESILSYCKSQGYNNYIISNNFPELGKVIQRLNLAKYFTDYFISSNIGYEKPRIEIFQYALSKAKFPEVCYMVGDNPIADIRGGNKAGLTTILVHNNSFDDSIQYNYCENLNDIKNIIK